MTQLILKPKQEKPLGLEEIVKRLDLQYTQIAYELEKLRNLSKKIQKIESRLKAIEELIKSDGIKIRPITPSTKTKETIKTLIKKYKMLTAAELGKLIKLSRNRCSEYLKSMEKEGILISRKKSRKKYYMLRQ